MFIRFRKRGKRTNITLVSTSREGKRVRQRHIASLGSEPEKRYWLFEYCQGRIWKYLCEAIDEHHLDDDTALALMRSLHARVPFPPASKVYKDAHDSTEIFAALERCRAALDGGFGGC